MEEEAAAVVAVEGVAEGVEVAHQEGTSLVEKEVEEVEQQQQDGLVVVVEGEEAVAAMEIQFEVVGGVDEILVVVWV
ncbi:hypothetical protein scyTo_0010568 [Scyliorhinus torazame]|uniref:Uncharacterized protein n=1 Tax=Scyliorhinus torazame TaxID=75743 RepID=A0A401P8S5_SCYTO|nr:hypothetical protein [Scyliorhinus torazame]